MVLASPWVLPDGAVASPRQLAEGIPVTTDEGGDPSSPQRTMSDPESAKSPRKPNPPTDSSLLAPPLPGYALMFILGGAIVALNLWSSKRVRPD